MESSAATRPLVAGLSVVYLYVKDIDRASAFYRDVLGLALEGDEHWREITFQNGVRFALHLWDEGAPEIAPGTIAVDFEVADIDETAQRLREAGVEIGEIHRQPYGSFLTFVDAEGYRLELYQPAAS